MQGEKIKILESFLGAHYKNNDEILFFCPKCKHHKKKLSINLKKGVFKCWVCDYAASNLDPLVKNYAPLADRASWAQISGQVELSDFEILFQEKKEKPSPRVQMPKYFISLTSHTLPPSSSAPLKYLASRGILKDKIKKYKIGYCHSGKYRNRVVIPSFDSTGHLNYFVSRTFVGAEPKYINPPSSKNIIFGELGIDWDDDIVIVEGVFDSMEVENSIPILGSTIRENSALFNRLISCNSKIYIALDPDASAKAFQIMNLFHSYGVAAKQIKIAGEKDISEMGGEYFNSLKNESNFLDKNDYLLYKLNML